MRKAKAVRAVASPTSPALGRYGHVEVSSPSGDFTSYNLSTDPAGANSTASCTIDGNGHGGSNQQAMSTKNTARSPARSC